MSRKQTYTFLRPNIDPELFKEQVDELKRIFTEFFNNHGHYPATSDLEILRKEYKVIPSPKTIQLWGGIRLFYERVIGIQYIHKNSEDNRSRVFLAGLDEKSFYQFLCEIFGEKKIISQSEYVYSSPRSPKSDFEVFYNDNRDSLFIDVFSAKDTRSFAGGLSVKLRRLAALTEPVTTPIFFVCMSDGINQFIIDTHIMCRREPIPSNIRILDLPTAINTFTKIANDKMV